MSVRDGYKMTDAGIIPLDWTIENFDSVINIVNGQVDPKIEPYCDMIHIGPGNVEKFTGKLIEYRTAKEDNQISGKYLFDDECVLYGKINPQLAKVCFPRFKGICSADMYAMRTVKNKLIPSFLKYILLSERFFKYSVSVSARTGMPKINREELSGFTVVVPSLPEQQRIAEILSSNDALITKTEELIEKTKEVKQGLMQELLTKGIGHTEFKDSEVGRIPKEWEVMTLEEVCTILDGKRKPVKSEDRENMKGNIPYYGASGIIDWVNDYIFDDELILLGEDGENIKSRNLPLAFRVSGKCWVNNHAHVFKISDEQRNNVDYVTYALENKDYSVFVIGSAQPKLNQAVCRKLLLATPTLDEQNKIASILLNIDNKLQALTKRKQQLEEIKQGLMQDLLTGRVRVNLN